jgi:hypothetical protein
MEANLHPAGYIRYSFNMYAAYEQSISCNFFDPRVREVVFEKVIPADMYSSEWQMTIHFGPITSIEYIDEVGEVIKDEILDILAFNLNTRITEIRLADHGLAPRPGEGAIAHILLPALCINTSAEVGCFTLSNTCVAEVQNTFLNTPKLPQFIHLFRCAISSDEPIVQFLLLYLILDGIFGDQKNIDKHILDNVPTTHQSVSPRNGRPETIYTRLRNEIGHRAFVNPEATKREIMNNLDSFRAIVRGIVESSAL